ncbi:MAG TPA: hypothetical protein VIW24_07930 [Aldersonia sp.]
MPRFNYTAHNNGTAAVITTDAGTLTVTRQRALHPARARAGAGGPAAQHRPSSTET